MAFVHTYERTFTPRRTEFREVGCGPFLAVEVVMTKQHTESRTRPGFSLCGKEMPYEASRWTTQESCCSCARVNDARMARNAQQGGLGSPERVARQMDKKESR